MRTPGEKNRCPICSRVRVGDQWVREEMGGAETFCRYVPVYCPHCWHGTWARLPARSREGVPDGEKG